MRIDKKLNLVVPVETDSGVIYFHSMPIGYETFKKYHMVIGITFNELIGSGMAASGAVLAAIHLEEVAIKLGKWEGADGVQNGLMEEIARLTNVAGLGDKGWESVPVSTAIKRGYVSEEEWEEAKQKIVFFILVSSMTKGAVMADFLKMTCEAWQTQTTSLNSTAYANSLPMLTETETSPQKENQSFHPA